MTAEIINISDRQRKAEKEAGITRVSMEDLFRVWTGQATMEEIQMDARHEETLDELRRWDIPALRRFWDGIGENSFYEGPEGMFDCSDIHRVLNEKGDGVYCAV